MDHKCQKICLFISESILYKKHAGEQLNILYFSKPQEPPISLLLYEVRKKTVAAYIIRVFVPCFSS